MQKRPRPPDRLRLTLLGVVATAVLLSVGVAANSSSANERSQSATTTTVAANHVHDDSHAHPSQLPQNVRERGLVYDSLEVPPIESRCAGLLVVKETGNCTHGPDVPPTGLDMQTQVQPAFTAAAEGICYGDGTSGNRVEVLYMHAPGNDRFAQYKSTFETWAVGMDTIYNESAKETGGQRHIRFVTDANCTPVVRNVTVSSGALSNFGTMIRELRGQGYNRQDRKYTVYGDASVYCGIGEFSGDSRKTASNTSNFGPSFARTDTTCWGPSVISHELGHNLGAVNNNAPNTSGGAHCTDEWDVMCYSDSPYYPPMRVVCGNRAHDQRLDCNHDDYYNTNPPAGSYLANFWNMADSTFLVNPGDGPGPTTTTTRPTTTTTRPTTTTGPTTTTTRPTTTTTSPPGCSAYPYRFTNSLNAGGYQYQPNGQWYYATNAGTHTSCLDGPTGADFDMYLQQWNGSSWATVARSTSPGPDENVSYNGSPGYYRILVQSYSGSGTYTVGLNGP